MRKGWCHFAQVLLLRMAKKNFTVTSKGKSFTVPKGHYVATSPYVAMRLPDVFKDPEKVGRSDDSGPIHDSCRLRSLPSPGARLRGPNLLRPDGFASAPVASGRFVIGALLVIIACSDSHALTRLPPLHPCHGRRQAQGRLWCVARNAHAFSPWGSLHRS